MAKITVAEKLAEELRTLANNKIHDNYDYNLMHNAADELERQTAWLHNMRIQLEEESLKRRIESVKELENSE